MKRHETLDPNAVTRDEFLSACNSALDRFASGDATEEAVKREIAGWVESYLSWRRAGG